MARTTYTMVARFLVEPRLRGVTESYVALVVTEELARELGVVGLGPILRQGSVDEAELTRAHSAITTPSSAAVAAAARRVWSRLFRTELAPLAVRPR
jgi:hypothetical protein